MPVAATETDYQTHKVSVWTGETGTSLSVEVGRYPNMSIQATGTGTVTVEGTNLNAADNKWFALKDHAGTAISLDATTNEINNVLEHPLRVRVVVAAGTATVSLVAHGDR